MKTSAVTINYFKITAENGDQGLFGHKLDAIESSVSPDDRELNIGTAYVNLTASRDVSTGYVMGHIRYLRHIAPSISKKGETSSRPIQLGNDEGVNERTHFVYDPSTSLIAVQYNHYGPRIGTLVDLVNSLYEGNVDKDERRSRYMPVVIDGKIELALSSTNIKAIVVRPSDPVARGIVSKDADLPDVLRAFQPPDGLSAEIIFKEKKGSRGEGHLTHLFRRDILRGREDLGSYDKLRVKLVDPSSGEIEECDLIKNKLHDRVTVGVIEGTKEINGTALIPAMAARLGNVREENIFS